MMQATSSVFRFAMATPTLKKETAYTARDSAFGTSPSGSVSASPTPRLSPLESVRYVRPLTPFRISVSGTRESRARESSVG